MVDTQAIQAAKDHFGVVLEQQLERVERLKSAAPPVDFSAVSPIHVGVMGGDGIGPYIAAEAQRVLEYLLREQVESGKVNFRVIEGLTIENRASHLKSIPERRAGGDQGVPRHAERPDPHPRAGRRLAQP